MKKAHLGIAFGAIALFAWVLAHVGFASLVEQLRALRIALPIVLGLSVLRLLLQSIAWSASLKGEHVYVDTSRLAAIRLAGRSTGVSDGPGSGDLRTDEDQAARRCRPTDGHSHVSRQWRLLVHFRTACNLWNR